MGSHCKVSENLEWGGVKLRGFWKSGENGVEKVMIFF